MSIVLSTTSSTPSQSGISYTAQDIISEVSQDLRRQLASTGTDGTIILSYVDRIHKEILRSSKWVYLLSDVKSFITELGVTDYWVGTAGGGPQGSSDTSLNLTDIYRLKDDTVLDRSNNVRLYRTLYQPPNLSTFEFPDGQSRLLRPTNFYHDNYKSLIRIFPAPNNQNSYQPVPESPLCITTSGGALSARTYTVRYTIVDSAGNESSASDKATTVYVPSGSLLKVMSPTFPVVGSSRTVSYGNYKVYAAVLGGTETLQSTSMTSGVNFTEPASGLVAGAAYPTVNNLTPLDGYLIAFRYYKLRQALTTGTQSLQLPDDYKDILIAGVNMLGYLYLGDPSQSKIWGEIYQQGMREMVRDSNHFRADDFIGPDAQTQVGPPSITGFITGN